MAMNIDDVVIESNGWMTPLQISHPDGVIELSSWSEVKEFIDEVKSKAEDTFGRSPIQD
jgi:hypothetical protein